MFFQLLILLTSPDLSSQYFIYIISHSLDFFNPWEEINKGKKQLLSCNMELVMLKREIPRAEAIAAQVYKRCGNHRKIRNSH